MGRDDRLQSQAPAPADSGRSEQLGFETENCHMAAKGFKNTQFVVCIPVGGTIGYFKVVPLRFKINFK